MTSSGERTQNTANGKLGDVHGAGNLLNGQLDGPESPEIFLPRTSWVSFAAPMTWPPHVSAFGVRGGDPGGLAFPANFIPFPPRAKEHGRKHFAHAALKSNCCETQTTRRPRSSQSGKRIDAVTQRAGKPIQFPENNRIDGPAAMSVCSCSNAGRSRFVPVALS